MEDIWVSFFAAWVFLSSFSVTLLVCFFRCPEVPSEEKLRVALKAASVVAVSCIVTRACDLFGVDRDWDLLIVLTAGAFAAIGFVSVVWEALGRGVDELFSLIHDAFADVGFDRSTTKPVGAGKFPASAE